MKESEIRSREQAMGTGAQVAGGAPNEDGVKIDGFQQVLQMLRMADHEFRESILKRVGQKDPKLAHALRADLRKYGL